MFYEAFVSLWTGHCTTYHGYYLKKKPTKTYLVFTGCHEFPNMYFFSFLQANKSILSDKETVSMAIQLLLELM